VFQRNSFEPIELTDSLSGLDVCLVDGIISDAGVTTFITAETENKFLVKILIKYFTGILVKFGLISYYF
jgi:hypothetical protein